MGQVLKSSVLVKMATKEHEVPDLHGTRERAKCTVHCTCFLKMKTRKPLGCNHFCLINFLIPRYCHNILGAQS